MSPLDEHKKSLMASLPSVTRFSRLSATNAEAKKLISLRKEKYLAALCRVHLGDGKLSKVNTK